MDLIKECVQCSATGVSWFEISFCPTSPPVHENIGKWFGNGNAEEIKAQKLMARKLFKPLSTSSTTPDLFHSDVDVDVDDLRLCSHKRRRHASKEGEVADFPSPDGDDEDIYFDRLSGTTIIDAEKLIEVREAAPFVWEGKSPFWSPLLLRRVLLVPIKGFCLHGTVEKVCVFFFYFIVFIFQTALSCIKHFNSFYSILIL